MGALICGGAVLQWPLGRLSDRFDRRLVVISVATAAALVGLLTAHLSVRGDTAMLTSVGLFGGLAFALHSLNIAHTNDWLHPSEMIGASSALVLLLGIGSIIGPLAVGIAMRVAGPIGFFWWLSAVLAGLAVFGLGCWRYYARRPHQERRPYVPVPTQPSSAVADAVEEVYANQNTRE